MRADFVLVTGIGVTFGFPLSIVLLFLFFVLAIPTVLYLAMKMCGDAVPLFLSPVLALAIMGLMVIIVRSYGPGPGPESETLVMISLYLLITSLAVIAPYSFFAKKKGMEKPWQIFPLVSFVGVVFFFFMSMDESLAGAPYPDFSRSLPLTGWFLDGIVSILHQQNAVYAFDSPLYSYIQTIGLYLEVFIIAFCCYALISLPSKSEIPDQK
jgi:hypothetical protein